MELHAHLNGSLSGDTLKELIELQKSSSGFEDATCNIWEAVIEHGERRTLEECFQVFSIAHTLTSTPKAVYKATQNVIKEFANEGVHYLELRSTPRAVPGVMTKKEYLKAIIDAIKDTTEKIIVKMLISIDRRQGSEVAEENLDLALIIRQQHPEILVGMDLSGDPTKGSVKEFLLVLERARSAGLKIALHCGEVPNADEVELILEFKPDRLGHCTCVHPLTGGTKELWNTLLAKKIPVELCLTSNVKSKTVENYKEHQFHHFFSAKHPITISTDDKGVFATSLSEEYALAAKHHNLSRKQLWELSLFSIDYTFASEDEKNQLKLLYSKVKESMLQN
ncbi:Adenosine deaminase-like protein [Blattella germanica]|nr:Adenosine deaminase-like protein [Blattella germanica]